MTTQVKRSKLLQPFNTFALFAVCVTALSILGLVMVFSASTIYSTKVNGNTYGTFVKQLVFLILALPIGWVAAKLRLNLWRAIGRISLLISIGMLAVLLIPGIGHAVNGNRNWIGIGPFVVQPSEFAKFLMILWAATMLAQYENAGIVRTNVLKLIVPGYFGVLIFVLAGKDLGTAAVIGATMAGLLFVSGIPLRLFGTISALGMAGVSILILSAPYRAARFLVLFNPFAEGDYKNYGWQPAHSLMGLATGGLLGVGLGASRQKWGYLAEAHTDFIFSVIGEELGLLGTIGTILLFCGLIFAIFRIAMRANDPMVRFTCAGIGVWISIQCFFNIGSAISLVPVVGVTLPLISYGGSSLISTYLALGFVLGAALRDPEVARGIREFRKSNSR
jgi:cell division protein FtsW